MENIIEHCNHRLTINFHELKKSIEVYSQIVPSVSDLQLGFS
jgi:hypothetical protein